MGLRQASLGGIVLVAMALLFTSGCIRSLKPNSPPRGGVLRPGPGEADPIVVNGIAAGDYSMGDGPERGSGCLGYVTLEPSFVIEMAFNVPFLRVFTVSDQDTTLAIRTPQGRWLCNDNTNGWNPSVEGQFLSGVYQVWVGSRHQNLSPAYRLAVTARQDVTSLGNVGSPQPTGAVTSQ